MAKFLTVLLFALVSISLWWTNPLAGQQPIPTDGWNQLLPDSGNRIDDRVSCQKSINNLDVVAFQDRYYLAFRTAPNHFASEKTELYILSSANLENWEFEYRIHLGHDMREPRFAVYRDRLRLYFFEGGKKANKFEPRKMWCTELSELGEWSSLIDLELDGFVNWRLRERSDTLYLSAYDGRNLYNKKHQGNQRLFYSTDGLSFEPISEQPQVIDHGAEEGEFIFDHRGDLWGTVRFEGGGGALVYAPSDNIADWQLYYSDHKYDSALLFEHRQTLYLIARRNLDGKAKKGRWRLYNLLRYSLTRKRTALYRIDKEKKSIEWIEDFPSTGDNAFPGIVPLDSNTYYLLNYSNDIYGRSMNWIRGQLKPTYIYEHRLDMSDY